MRKLKLDVEKLEITSFATEAQERARGTVGGHGNQPAASGPLVETCAPGCVSGVNTCGWTCGYVDPCSWEPGSSVCGGPTD